MAGLGAVSGAAQRDTLLMAILKEQRPRVHVEGVATLAGSELPLRPMHGACPVRSKCVGRRHRGVGDRKTPPQHGLPESTGELLPAEITERNLLGRVGGEPCHPGELVGTADDAAEESKGGVGGDEGLRAGGAAGLADRDSRKP